MEAGKDVRCLDQKQRMVCDSRQQPEPAISIVMGQFPKLRTPQRVRRHLRTQWLCYRRGTLTSGTLNLSWEAVSMPTLRSGGRKELYISRLLTYTVLNSIFPEFMSIRKL